MAPWACVQLLESLKWSKTIPFLFLKSPQFGHFTPACGFRMLGCPWTKCRQIFDAQHNITSYLSAHNCSNLGSWHLLPLPLSNCRILQMYAYSNPPGYSQIMPSYNPHHPSSTNAPQLRAQPLPRYAPSPAPPQYAAGLAYPACATAVVSQLFYACFVCLGS